MQDHEGVQEIGVEEGPKAAAPYVTYGGEEELVQSVAAVPRVQDGALAGYARPILASQAAEELCEKLGLKPRPLFLADGSGVKGMVVTSLPQGEAYLPAGYDAEFVKVPLTAAGLHYGVVLKVQDSMTSGMVWPWLLELVAVTEFYNRKWGTDYRVQFEPNAARYSAKSLGGTAILGSTADEAVLKAMLAEITATEYGSPRFWMSVDDSPGVVLKSGTKSWEVTKLAYRTTKSAVIMGVDPSEYQDAMGSGVPAGLVIHELGQEVSIANVYSMQGYDKTKRVLLETSLANEYKLCEAIDKCDGMARQNRPIMFGERLVAICKMESAELVYKGIFGKEVREVGGGGAALRAQIESLQGQMSEADEAAAEERERAAAAAEVAAAAVRAADEQRAALAAEVTRLGGATTDLSQRLAGSETARRTAEAAAVARHGEAQAMAREAAEAAAGQKETQAALLEAQARIEAMMSSAVARLGAPAAGARSRELTDAGSAEAVVVEEVEGPGGL